MGAGLGAQCPRRVRRSKCEYHACIFVGLGGLCGDMHAWAVTSTGLEGALEPVGIYMRVQVSPTSHALCSFKSSSRPPPQAVAGGFPWRWNPAPSTGRDGGSLEESLLQTNGLFR